MQKAIIFSFVFILSILSSYSQTATGINTTTPRKTLEVNGSTKVSGDLNIGTINDIEKTDTYTFLMQEPTKQIKALDVASSTEGNALGYYIKYRISDVDLDWLYDLDTGILADDFIVIVISSRFNKTIKASSGYAIPLSEAFIAAPTSGGGSNTWHLRADFPGISPTQDGEWNIKLLVVTKDLIKDFGVQNFSMSSGTTGAAVAPVLN